MPWNQEFVSHRILAHCSHSLEWPPNRCPLLNTDDDGSCQWSALIISQSLLFFSSLLILDDCNLYPIILRFAGCFCWFTFPMEHPLLGESLYRISFLGLVKQIQVMTSQHKLHRPGRIRKLVGGFEGRAATLVRSSEGLWGRNQPSRDRCFFLVVNCSGMEKPQFPKGFSMNCWLVEVIGWFV